MLYFVGLQTLQWFKFFLLLAVCAPLQAQQLIIGGFSKHANAGYNETHAGLGISHKGTVAGVFRNSLDRNAFYVGKEWRTAGNYGAGVIAGGVTGYNNSAVPMIVPYVYATLGPVEINLTGVPKLTRQSSAVAMIIFRININ